MPEYEEELCDVTCPCTSAPTIQGARVARCDGTTAEYVCSSGFTFLAQVSSTLTCDFATGVWSSPTTDVWDRPLGCHAKAWTQTSPELESTFIVLEHRTVSAASYSFTSSLHGCIETCRGIPNCPGFVWSGNGGKWAAKCELIDTWLLENRPINRHATTHMVMRRGFLRSTAATPELIDAAASATEWTSELADRILAANRAQTKRMGALPFNDTLWDWIESVPTEHMAQGVPLSKSIFSYTYPVHPNIFLHLRFLKNYYSTGAHAAYSEGNISMLADFLLGMSIKHRYLPSIAANSTAATNVQKDVTDSFYEYCHREGYTYPQGTTINGVDISEWVRFPLVKDPLPSPLATMDWLLQRNQTDGLWFPIFDAPWNLVVPLNTGGFDRGSCDWVIDTYRQPTAINGNITSEVPGASTGAGYNSERPASLMCKQSPYAPGMLPKLKEHGGACGTVSLSAIGTHSCTGIPAHFAKQPRHAANWKFKKSGSKYGTEFGLSLAPMFWTTYSQGTQDLTDEVPGTGKRRSGPIDYVLAQPNQANAGLDSYLDVRLAMILFRSVYNSEGATYLPKLASLLLDALEKNPHHMEAWDLLITHIKAGSIADDALIARTHNVLRAHSGSYQQTYLKMLAALAARYSCSDGNGEGTVLNYMETEWTQTVSTSCAPAADAFESLRMKHAIFDCVFSAFPTYSSLLDYYEDDMLRAAWSDCSPPDVTQYVAGDFYEISGGGLTETIIDTPSYSTLFFCWSPYYRKYYGMMYCHLYEGIRVLFGNPFSYTDFGVTHTSEDLVAAEAWLKSFANKLIIGVLDSESLDSPTVHETSTFQLVRLTIQKLLVMQGKDDEALAYGYSISQLLADPVSLQAQGQLGASQATLTALQRRYPSQYSFQGVTTAMQLIAPADTALQPITLRASAAVGGTPSALMPPVTCSSSRPM